MRKILTEEEFNLLKNYVISNGNNPNVDRCCIFFNGEIDITLCFNEITNTVSICEGSFSKSFLGSDMIDYLIDLAKSGVVNEIALETYNKLIEPHSFCCE